MIEIDSFMPVALKGIIVSRYVSAERLISTAYTQSFI
jgi:hypothetical protein